LGDLENFVHCRGLILGWLANYIVLHYFIIIQLAILFIVFVANFH